MRVDEPTNHLDLPPVERLEAALEAYPGAIVLVTHDDALAARCTRSVWSVADIRVERARARVPPPRDAGGARRRGPPGRRGFQTPAPVTSRNRGRPGLAARVQ